MSVTGEPVPGSIETSIPSRIQEVLKKLPEDFSVFNAGAQKAALMIALLDEGKVFLNKTGLTPDEGINQFIKQLASSRFATEIYMHGRGRLADRLNPFATRLPRWLETAINNNASGEGSGINKKEIQEVSDHWVGYGEKYGRRLKSERDWVEELFAFDDVKPEQSGDRRMDALDMVTGNAKIYVDGSNMLNWQNVEDFLRLLRKDNLHPSSGKINRAAQKLVFYYQKPIPRIKQLFFAAKQTGVIIRGPAQDVLPIFVWSDGRWKPNYDWIESNDGSLENHARENDFHYKSRGYNQADFFRAYIDMVSYNSKNPSLPYMLAAIQVRYAKEQTEASKRTITWLRDTIKFRSGLDIRIGQTLGEPYMKK